MEPCEEFWDKGRKSREGSFGRRHDEWEHLLTTGFATSRRLTFSGKRSITVRKGAMGLV